MDEFVASATAIAAVVAVRLVGAIVLWIVGRWVIGWLVRLARGAMSRRDVDPTLSRYVGSATSVGLTAILVVSILGVLGVETATFAAIFAAVGLAIGLAWSGLLANFAGGAFMMVLRPFQTGDFVTAGGVTGTVEEIGMFVTTLNTPDNVRTYVGNSKIFGDVIQNFSANAYRRVDLVAQLSHDTDPEQAIRILRERLRRIPHVMETPAPDVHILQFTAAGPLLAVRPYAPNAHYWDVWFETNRAIREEFTRAGFAVPEERVRLHQTAA